MRHERRGLRGSTRLIHVHAHSTTGGTFPPLQRLHRAPFTAARPRARPMMPTPSGKEGSANTCGSPPLCQALATGECMYGIPRCVLGRVLEAVEAVIAHTRPSARHGVRLSSITHVKADKEKADTVRLSVCRQSTDQKSCLSVEPSAGCPPGPPTFAHARHVRRALTSVDRGLSSVSATAVDPFLPRALLITRAISPDKIYLACRSSSVFYMIPAIEETRTRCRLARVGRARLLARSESGLARLATSEDGAIAATAAVRPGGGALRGATARSGNGALRAASGSVLQLVRRHRRSTQYTRRGC